MQIVVCRSGTAIIEFSLNVSGLTKIVCVNTKMIFVFTEMTSVATEGTSGVRNSSR